MLLNHILADQANHPAPSVPLCRSGYPGLSQTSFKKLRSNCLKSLNYLPTIPLNNPSPPTIKTINDNPHPLHDMAEVAALDPTRPGPQAVSCALS